MAFLKRFGRRKKDDIRAEGDNGVNGKSLSASDDGLAESDAERPETYRSARSKSLAMGFENGSIIISPHGRSARSLQPIRYVGEPRPADLF